MAEEERTHYKVIIQERKKRTILFFIENDTILIKVNVKNPSEIKILEEEGFEKEDSQTYTTTDSILFLKTLVYYGVIQWTRDTFKKSRIKEMINEQSGYDIRFWANKLWNAYKERGIRGMARPARAFKVLLNV